MKGIRAVFYKEWALFWNGNGISVLLFPAVLLLALWYGIGDFSAQYIQPFPVAICDQDDTLMSHSLISQMDRVELFSDIMLMKEGETDTQMLERGAAAVVTIPKDFFYDLYEMKDCPVDVVLNKNMELEASVFQSVFSSVMKIIEENQAVGQGLYTFCYGDEEKSYNEAMYAEIAEHLWQDALGRQLVFSSAIEETDVGGLVVRRLLVSLFSVLGLFFSLSVVKTLPEEIELGIVDRYRAAGGSVVLFVGIKFLTALSCMALALVVAMIIFPVCRTVLFVLLTLTFLGTAFCLLLALAVWSDSAMEVQRWGNLLILVSLVFSGSLWPVSILGGGLDRLRSVVPSYYLTVGLEAMACGVKEMKMLYFLWPLVLLGGVGISLTFWGWHQKGRCVQKKSDKPFAFMLPSGMGAYGRTGKLARMKFWVMLGGVKSMLLWMGVLLFCGATVSVLQTDRVSKLRIAVSDLDNSDHSQELIQYLTDQTGLQIILCDADRGTDLLVKGEIEGVLHIDAGYESALESDRQQYLHYRASASSMSAQGAREIIAGQAIAQRSRVQAVRQASKHLGKELSEDEKKSLFHSIEQAENRSPQLYRIRMAMGNDIPEPFLPDERSFAILAVLLTLFMLVSWSGEDGKKVDQRMRSLPGGYRLSYDSDVLALLLSGVVAAIAVMIPAGSLSVNVIGVATVYSLCIAILARTFIYPAATAGQVNGMAPFLALILCLFGGCFLELSRLSPGFAEISRLLPTGLAMRAMNGSQDALFRLVIETVVFGACGIIRVKSGV